MTNTQKAGRDGKNESIWQTLDELPASHTENIETVYEVLIIGGGITGLSTAYRLQKAGKQCLLVESAQLGFGTTGGTSAHLNTFLDASYPEIENDFSKDASRLLANSAKRMIATIAENISSLGFDADFEYKAGYLFSQDQSQTQELKKIYNSSKRAGVDVLQSNHNGLPIPLEEALLFKNQAQFHPLKYIKGLADGFCRLGGEILEETMIAETKYKDGIHEATAKDKKIRAKNLVWATHIPPGINVHSFRNAPYRSYVIAVTLTDEAYPDCLAYDMEEPYHYFRSHSIDGQKYLLVGGADHKTGHDDPQQAFADLEKYVRSYFSVAEVNFRWSSQYYVPVDGLPYIGQLPLADENTFIATGFNGNGMIFGTLSAEIIADLILGKESELSSLLSPARLKPLAGFSEFVKENADVAYHFFADRFGSEVLDSLVALPRGEGKLVSFEGQKLALYKNQQGKVQALNPVCTHAGCIVQWNGSEKSWDCPCHGGRFDIDGKVVTGPPRQPLARVDI